MKNKKNFRIKRSVKMEALAGKSQLIRQTLQRIVGGRTNAAQATPMYGRVMGLYEQNA